MVKAEIFASIVTDSSGNLPIADSPESITQSVPSKMAFATSVASALVGRRLEVRLQHPSVRIHERLVDGVDTAGQGKFETFAVVIRERTDAKIYPGVSPLRDRSSPPTATVQCTSLPSTRSTKSCTNPSLKKFTYEPKTMFGYKPEVNCRALDQPMGL